MKRILKNRTHWLQRIVFILIALFAFQSNLLAVHLSQLEGCLEIGHLRDITELDENGCQHISEYHFLESRMSFIEGSEPENTHFIRIISAGVMASSSILGWGKNSVGHLIKHRNVLGFGNISAQQAQKMLPQLRGAANQLLNNANPALTRVGNWNTGRCDFDSFGELQKWYPD